ncbi:helix-turn-helix domain-containing protein [Sporosarcina ureilytica]|uniref:Insertion element IS150 protein InsJ-like helix-turn-helix domain-containing protein n=1 Tax=Sporosarcina ureilytica TaxID=298596 RepID=A0A1D8JFI3_9BACL|nr:helix-turn-helix domain-containing protein [Sporosarcina ureilytica]AOV07474.1 hypothetical protein BI350_07925 [Sporosarcina ureilytica]
MYIRKKLQKRRSPFETKMYAVKQVIEFHRSKRVVAEEIGISVSLVINWVKTFEQHGEAGLQSKKSHSLSDGGGELERLRCIEKKYYQQLEKIEIPKKFQTILRENKNKNHMMP